MKRYNAIAALFAAAEGAQATGGNAEPPVSMVPGKDAKGSHKEALKVGKPLTATELVHVTFGVEETKREVSLMEHFRLSLAATDQQTFGKAIKDFPEAAERAGKNRKTAEQYRSRFKSMYWAVRLKGPEILAGLGREKAYAVSRDVLKAAGYGTNGQKLLSSEERQQRAEDKAADAVTIKAGRMLRGQGIHKPTAGQLAEAMAEASTAVAQEWAVETAAGMLEKWGAYKAELVAKEIIGAIEGQRKADEAKKSKEAKTGTHH